MKKSVRILLALGVGFAAAMLIMAVAVYFGYTEAYRTETNVLTVKILGLPLYRLTRQDGRYIGQSQNIYMGIFSAGCMAAAFALEEIAAKVKFKKKI